jgi:hypothetical protein
LGVERVHDVVQQYPLLSRRWVDLQIGAIMINSLLNDCTLIFSSGLLVVSSGSAETLKSAYLFRTTIFLWFVTRTQLGRSTLG